jgi:arsenate reductase
MNIRILCTGNSARSILLESILNRDSAGRIHAFSAGSTPSGRVHPQSLKLLAAKGYPTDGLSSQSWDDFATPSAPQMDVVITVCTARHQKPARFGHDPLVTPHCKHTGASPILPPQSNQTGTSHSRPPLTPCPARQRR